MGDKLPLEQPLEMGKYGIAFYFLRNGQGYVRLRATFAFNERVRALSSRRFNKRDRTWEIRILRGNAFRLLDWYDNGYISMSPDLVEELKKRIEVKKIEQRSWPKNFAFKSEPFELQYKAEQFMYARDQWALFADMGCGKSKMVIDVATAHLKEGRIDGFIVLSRVSIREKWLEEIEKHCSLEDIDTYVLKSTKASVKKIANIDPSKPFFVSVGTESLSGKLYKGQVFEALKDLVSSSRTMLVIDESHYIKSHKSNRTKNTLALGGYCPIRGIMTGTPVPKNILDLYSPYEFLDPDILGFPTFFSFKLNHAILSGFNGKEIIGFRNVEEILEKTKDHTYRMDRDDLIKLPPLIRRSVSIKMTKLMEAAYHLMKKDKMLKIEEQEIVSSTEMVSVYTKLRALSSGYIRNEDKEVIWIEKPKNLPKIKELKSILDSNEEKMIIWVNTHPEIFAVKEALGDEVIEYSGKISVAEREKNLKLFRSGMVRSIVATIPSMQTGLDLIEATTEVFFSLPLSYTDFVQAEARAYRIGQKKKVMVLMLVTDNTVDIDILSAILEKKDVHEFVMEKPMHKRFIHELVKGGSQ